MSRRTVALLLLLAVSNPGCAPSPSSAGWDSDDPAALLYSIQNAARTRDPAAVPHLVDALRSDDPAVRLLAEQTLEEITGTDVGYRHFDPPAQRAVDIERWTSLLRRDGWLRATTDPQGPLMKP